MFLRNSLEESLPSRYLIISEGGNKILSAICRLHQFLQTVKGNLLDLLPVLYHKLVFGFLAKLEGTTSLQIVSNFSLSLFLILYGSADAAATNFLYTSELANQIVYTTSPLWSELKCQHLRLTHSEKAAHTFLLPCISALFTR